MRSPALARSRSTHFTKQRRDSDRPDVLIRTQAAEAPENGVTAAPALRLRDHDKALLLRSPVEGDALLSALDLLAAGEMTTIDPSRSPDMPTESVGDMPR